MRRAAAVDANQMAIIRALRKAGVSVQPLHTVGQGCPDIIAGFRGVNYLLELKDGSKPPSERRLTEAQKVWHANWRGQVSICESLDDVATLVNVWRVL